MNRNIIKPNVKKVIKNDRVESNITESELLKSRPWLSLYPSDIPRFINDNEYTSLIHLFECSVAEHGDKIAFINMDITLTFDQLEQKSRAFAAYLQQQLKLDKGARVALMMPNLLQYPIALLGVIRAGCIAVNVNPLYTPRELAHQLQDAQAEAIVIVSNFATTLEQVLTTHALNYNLKHIILTEIADQFDQPKRIIANFVVHYVKKLVPNYYLPNAIPYLTVLKKGAQLNYDKPEVQSDDIAILQYTGGTTGVAKGAMLTHRNIIANLLQAKAFYTPALTDAHEMMVTALPMYHIFALTINCWLFLELGYTNLLITNPRDIPDVVKTLKKYPFTVMTGVNTLFNALMNNKSFQQLDFSKFKFSVAGGMPLQQSVAERWTKLVGPNIYEGYGLTECAPLVSAYLYHMPKFNSSIGVPVPSTEIQLIDNNGQIVTDGQPGELLVRGPQVMKGYWHNPEATAAVINKEGWFATGDIVQFDKYGFLHVIDRKKDMVLVSGFNVYPNEVEDIIMNHPKVLEVAVISQPNEETGELVKACVVKKDPSLTKEELLAHCRQSLTAYKVPKVIVFYNELPKSNVGKILRRLLKDEHQDEIKKYISANQNDELKE